MSQNVKIEQAGAQGRGLEFLGPANYKTNIRGNFRPDKHWLYCDFDTPAIDETNEWAVNESHGGSAAIVAAKNGIYRLTTSTTDNDKCEVARELCWYASCAAILVVAVKVDAITTVGLNVGLVDTKSYNDNQVAFEISGATIVDRCSNGVAWVFDTDGTDQYWHYCNSKAGVQAGTSITVTPVAATYEIFQISLDTSGNATFYRNGTLKGHKASAITTTTALTPYFAVISRAGTAARNFDVDFLYCWQNRGY